MRRGQAPPADQPGEHQDVAEVLSGRVILCVDLDQFYVAVERRRDEALAGRPVIVGSDPKEGRGRGVVAAASYEARRLGVRSGMPISWAWRRCGRRAVWLRPDFEAYAAASGRVMARLRRRADRFEPASIDEAYLDVSGRTGRSFDRAFDLATDLKREVREEEGLSCSVGAGPNKLIAKVASDFKKPDGLWVVPPGEAEGFLAPLDAGVLPGVGPKTRARLERAGLRTCADLVRAPVAALREMGFGAAAAEALRLEARGLDESEVVSDWEPKSIGRETTFDEDVGDPAAVVAALDDLAAEVHRGLAGEGRLFRTVVVKLRYSDFETHTRRRTLRDASTDPGLLARIARELAAPLLAAGRRVRLVGVQAAGLSRPPPGLPFPPDG